MEDIKILDDIIYLFKKNKWIIIISILIIIIYFNLNFINNYKEYNLYNGEKWDEYRIGDVIEGHIYENKDCPKEPWNRTYLRDISINYPNSFASKYVEQSGFPRSFKKNDYDILENIFKGFNYKKPDKETLVIHLRLGDVLTYRPDMYYTIDYYHKLFDKVKENKSIKKVDIITGLHKNTNVKMSNDKLNQVRNIFEENYPVNVIITNNPDKDLYYMCHSKFFCKSGPKGGFSKIISDYVKRDKNNIVYEE